MQRKELVEKDLFSSGQSRKICPSMNKKKGWGLLRPRPPSRLFNPDILQFAGVFGEYPLPAFGHGNFDMAGFVFAVDALVVISACAHHMLCRIPTPFNHDLTVGPCLVPYFGNSHVRQAQFTFRARVVGEDGVLSHLDVHRTDFLNVIGLGQYVLGDGNGLHFGGRGLRCFCHRPAFLSLGHNIPFVSGLISAWSSVTGIPLPCHSLCPYNNIFNALCQPFSRCIS